MITFKKEQVILVTGASSGIGRSIALMLNSLGASVVAIGRDIDKLNDLYDLSIKNNFYIEQRDLAKNIDSIPEYVTQLRRKYGKFYGLVCCAGITQIAPIKSLDLEESKQLFDINFFSPIFMLKGFCDKRNNTGLGANAVLISSTSAKHPLRGMSVYSASKAALKLASLCATQEYGNKIRINVISPADINTPMNDFCYGAREDRLVNYPMGFGEPEDIANVCAFLLSDKARWISGSDFDVTGGSI